MNKICMHGDWGSGRAHRIAVLALAAILMIGSAGCATVALERSKIEPLKVVDFVRVETPPLRVLTFMQALANSSAVGTGLIPGAIAESQGNTLVSPPAIPDLGALVSDGLRARLPQQAPWWPEMIDVDRIPGDLTQLRRKVERAAQWLVNEIAATVR